MRFSTLMFAAASILFFGSCKKEKSSMTGWNYNDKHWGGFSHTQKFKGQEAGPGLVFIEGGSFSMGQTEQNVTYDFDNIPRTVTVPSFYMDQTEVKNMDYREYLYWVIKTFSSDFPEVARAALPDTLVWRDELAYNEPYVEYYFRYPAYDYYPVVGVSWVQATEFCKWRTDRVNEGILYNNKILNKNFVQTNPEYFNTEAYLLGQYEGDPSKHQMKDLNPNGTGTRKVIMEDGMLQPDFQLPTEAEWEFAALSLIGNNPFQADKKGKDGEELVTDRKIYPWNNNTMRDSRHGDWQGDFLANYKRGRGDQMGVSGGLNDDADITSPVNAYMPNDFGLYNMAGNVSEWVMDVYRPLSFDDFSDFGSFRGNVFMKDSIDQDYVHVDRDSLGRVVKVPVTEAENVNRLNYKKSDVIGFIDGDGDANDLLSWMPYDYSVTTLINDKARVYKGGSWDDRAYYLSPGTRRFLQETDALSTLGFRCAMPRLGSPGGNDNPAGKYFKVKKHKH